MDLNRTGRGRGAWPMVGLIASLLAATALFRGAAAEMGPPQWGSDYMFENSNCTGQKDPINLMFYKAGYRALSKVEQNLGWTLIDGDTMHVWDMFQCVPSAQRGGFQQRKSEPFNCSWIFADGIWWQICDKYHIRLWDGRVPDGTWGYYTGGGTHRDVGFYCGFPAHFGADFDGAREQVRAAFQSLGYFTWTNYWGNTAHVSQPCGQPDTWG